MGLDYPGLLADLRTESDNLIAALRGLDADQWTLATPAAGWSINDQVSHLAFFDDATRLASADPIAFRAEADQLISGGMDFPDRIAARYRDVTPERQLEWFTTARSQLLAAFGGDDPKRRLPWFGPDMSVASSATARLMETWAHGQDVYDAVGIAHPPSPGLRSIAHLGVATFAFAHTLNGMAVPGEAIRVVLHSPDGDEWTWGPVHSANQVHGTAEDFVLTVTQRRHWTETGLRAVGPVAQGWLEIAQAFAGAPSRRAMH
ncbi:TIGR03084 family metal-binding protein [Mycolicibacterium vinylchloridicum]|uniref:TIGR03084 family metal-binding protein n=1 Tax=Mycolicibacterium vinylchloridicum TaxID=2736928 RepID=UPI0015CE7EF0|nr:TIGR03084 family metal-binding protein [Mycolicibacterium vinylchloridicum]